MTRSYHGNGDPEHESPVWAQRIYDRERRARHELESSDAWEIARQAHNAATLERLRLQACISFDRDAE